MRFETPRAHPGSDEPAQPCQCPMPETLQLSQVFIRNVSLTVQAGVVGISQHSQLAQVTFPTLD